MDTYHGTTIVCVRRETPDGVQVAIGGDGQVTLGNVVVKGTARKVRRLVRVAIGGLELGDLPAGQVRVLGAEDVRKLTG